MPSGAQGVNEETDIGQKTVTEYGRYDSIKYTGLYRRSDQGHPSGGGGRGGGAGKKAFQRSDLDSFFFF